MVAPTRRSEPSGAVLADGTDRRAAAGAHVAPPIADPIGAARLFEVLADGTRRRILALLLDHHEICVCRLVGALDQPQPKVSRHLAAMRDAGLLVARRKGTWILYRFDPLVPGWMMRIVAAMVDGTRADPQCAADRRRLATLRLCAEDGDP